MEFQWTCVSMIQGQIADGGLRQFNYVTLDFSLYCLRLYHSLECAMKIGNWNLERVLPTQARSTSIRANLLEIDADTWILTETHALVGPGSAYSSVMS